MPRRRFRWLLALVAVLPGCSSPGASNSGSVSVPAKDLPFQRADTGQPLVRVKVLENQSAVRLSATANPTFTLGTSQPRYLGIAGRTITVQLTPRGWNLGGSLVSVPGGGVPPLELVPEPDGSLALNNLSYRGKYRVVPVGPDRFDVINDVDIDSYLKSVVSKELYKDWQPESYRAQAIAARTYALYELATVAKGQTFDVFDDERSQVYGGISAETALSRQAVDDTRGVVLAYGPAGQERIFKTYFSACCGGIGQNPTDAFIVDDTIPPLVEKNAGSLCSASPRYEWGPVMLTRAEVTRRIRIYGERRNRSERNIGTVTRIVPAYANRFGRPVRYTVTDATGQRYSFPAEELRQALNSGAASRQIYSAFISVTPTAAGFVFSGRGSGHGVGLCQYCMEALARQGYRHEAILQYSYPTARLVRGY